MFNIGDTVCDKYIIVGHRVPIIGEEFLKFDHRTAEPVVFRCERSGGQLPWWIVEKVVAPDGWELGGCGEFMLDGGKVVKGGGRGVSVSFVWPEWLTCDFVAKDSSGSWYGYDCRPHKCSEQWTCRGKHICLALTTFNGPEVGWEDSLLCRK